MDALDDPVEPVRFAAAEALVRNDDPRGLPILAARVDDPTYGGSNALPALAPFAETTFGLDGREPGDEVERAARLSRLRAWADGQARAPLGP